MRILESGLILKMGKILKHGRDYRGIAYGVTCISALILKCLYFQLTTQLNSRPFFSEINMLMMLSTLGMLLILMSVGMILSGRHWFAALFVLNILLTIVLVSDTNCFRFYQGAITIPLLLQANLSQLSSIDDCIKSLFVIKDIIYIIDLPFLLIFLIMLYRNGVKKLVWKKRLITSTLFLILEIGRASCRERV